MTYMLPEFRFTPQEAADFKRRGKRCAKKGGPDCKRLRICGYYVWLPPEPFTDGRRRVEYFPRGVVFQVYSRKGECVGAYKDLEGAQQLMSKRGRKAGHEMHVCVDYSPRGWCAPVTARICVARIGRQLAQTLYVHDGNTEPDEVEPA
ncbi:MAG: hypothetical protein V7638_3872 [Acidobacteriota bacterium]|jgi:hypothetical protein